MAKVEINLDEKSVAILKSIDVVHRDSVINLGLALVQKTNYFKTILGTLETDKLDDVLSMDTIGNNTKVEEVKPEVKKEVTKSTSWDNF